MGRNKCRNMPASQRPTGRSGWSHAGTCRAYVAQILCSSEENYAPWLIPGYKAIRVKLLFVIDGTKDEAPKGTMLNTYNKGVLAFNQKEGPDSYPGDKGTAVHTIWLKGWFGAYIKHIIQGSKL